jgi:hypothetical protein
MRLLSLVLAVVLVSALCLPAIAQADSGSISRDSLGQTTYGTHDPLGGPPTPHVFALSQPLIFCAGIALLVLAALLGAYTFVSARRPTER